MIIISLHGSDRPTSCWSNGLPALLHLISLYLGNIVDHVILETFDRLNLKAHLLTNHGFL